MSKTLIQTSSIGKASVYGYKIPACQVSDINLVEFELEKCLGGPFMDHLKGNMIDYSNAKAWVSSLTYKKDSIVMLHGSFWIATKDNASQEPSLSACWVKGGKFKSDCLNELWCDGSLFTYMDIMIQIQVAPELSMPLGSKGWVRNTSKEYESLSPKEIGIRLNMLKAKAGTAIEMLDGWIKKKCDQKGYEGCFDLYKGLDRDCCGGCGCIRLSCSCSDCVEEIKNWNDFGVA